MKLVRLLILLGIVGGGYQYWKAHHDGSGPSMAAAPVTSQNGFVALPPVDGESTRAVLIVAAENCPHEDAQRADRLAEDLSRRGIAVVRTHHISFNLTSPDSSAAERITSVMNGSLPIVFVRGSAKSNPTLDEVVAEYEGAVQ